MQQLRKKPEQNKPLILCQLLCLQKFASWKISPKLSHISKSCPILRSHVYRHSSYLTLIFFPYPLINHIELPSSGTYFGSARVKSISAPGNSVNSHCWNLLTTLADWETTFRTSECLSHQPQSIFKKKKIPQRGGKREEILSPKI